MSLQLKFKGFDKLLEDIKDAEGNVDRVVQKCLEASAEIIRENYISEMSASRVSGSLIGRMNGNRYTKKGNRYSAKVGYIKGSYNSKNPSDGYKALFINYGTPRIKPREFIARMKKKSKAPVKKEQEKILKEILEDLKR